MQLRKSLIFATILASLGIQAFDGRSELSAQIKIMPLGDSITRGDGGVQPFNSYRKPLKSILASRGVDLDFVGGRSDGDGTDNDHQGVPGFRADQIAKDITAYLDDNPPEMVILHIGTNDLSSGEPPEEALVDIEDIVDGIFSFDQSIKIVLCSIVPRTDMENPDNIILNGLIRDLVDEKVGSGFLIWHVDQYAALTANPNWATELMSGSFHPNDKGYAVMADTFADAVQAVMAALEPGVAETFERPGPVLGSNWATDPAYSLVNGELANVDNSSFFPLAVWTSNPNPTEVKIKWSDNASSLGINEGGLALRLDRPTPDASGYFIWLGTSAGGRKSIFLWQIINGAPAISFPEFPYTLADPEPGDIYSVKLFSDANGHHFDTYINGVFYGRVSDTQKAQGNAPALYGGVMLRGGLANNIEEFDFASSADVIAPAKVTDLTAQIAGGGNASLTWTATGDDGNTGLATAYEVRFSTVEITRENYPSLQTASFPPTPRGPGSLESMTVTGLNENTQYFFAVKVSDDAGNFSGLSNVVSVTTPQGAGFVDDFERDVLGPDWITDPGFAIEIGDLCNTAIFENWDMAVYIGKKNPVKASLKWATDADALGIDQGGLAVLLDNPLTTASGYFIFRRPIEGKLALWEILNGAPVREIHSLTGLRPGIDDDDVFEVVVRREANGNFFDVFIDGEFDGTLQDLGKAQGNAATTYAGLMMLGNRNNCVKEFGMVGEVGLATTITIFSGDNQSGEIGQTLPQPLSVLVTDDNDNPKPGEEVKFEVIQGTGTLESVPGFEFRVDVGGAETYVDSKGKTWLADKFFTVGSYGYANGNTAFKNSRISNTTDDIIYQSEVWGLSAYRVDNLENGDYTVIIHFCELTYNDPGFRIFDVSLEGKTVLSSFDPAKEAGGKNIAFTRSFTVNVEDGRLDVGFGKKTENPSFVGLEILGSNANKTNAAGIASQIFTGGGAPGINTVQVTGVSFAAQSPVFFNLLTDAGPATQLIKFSGDGQSGSGGTLLPQPIIAVVRDALNNPKANFSVQFLVTRGGGDPDSMTATTDFDGQAILDFTLGTHNEQNEIKAIGYNASGFPLTGSPLTFTATSTVGVGKSLQLISGSGQSGPVNSALPQPVVVKVLDVLGNGVPGFPVGFRVKRGGGAIAASSFIKKNQEFEEEFVTQDGVVGLVASGWSANASLAIDTTHTKAPGYLSISSQRMITTGAATETELQYHVADFTPPAPGTRMMMSFMYRTDGDRDFPIEIELENALSPFNDFRRFKLPATGGEWKSAVRRFIWDFSETEFFFKLRLLNNMIADIDHVNFYHMTDDQGMLSTTWTMGDTASQADLGLIQSVEAFAVAEGQVLTNSPLQFLATAVAGAPDKLVLEGGNSQVGTVGKTLPDPLAVKVVDASGNALVNHPVTFTVNAGGGTLQGGLTTVTVNSDASGIASAILTLGNSVGVANVVTATSTHLGAALKNSPVTFSAVAALPTKVVKLDGDNQTGSAGKPLNAPLKALVLDNQDRPIAGYPVTFTILAGEGSINGQNSLIIPTGASGEALATLTLGPKPGVANTVQVSVTNNGAHLSGSPFTFNAASAPLNGLQLVDGNGQTGTVGTPLSQNLKVKVIDQLGGGISGWPVTFSVKAGGAKFEGNFTSKTVSTDSVGVASARLILGPAPGVDNNLVEASATIDGNQLNGSPITFKASATVGTPVALTIAEGDSQRGVVGLPLPSPLKAKVIDGLGNGVGGFPVTFAIKAGGGFLDGTPGATTATHNTDANGLAQVTLTVGNTSGQNNNIIEATAVNGSAQLRNSPLIFVSSATSSAARNIAYLSGNEQTGTAGQALPQAIVVKVSDDSPGRNPVPNHPVIFRVKSGGGVFQSNGLAEVVISADENGQAAVVWVVGGDTAPNAQIVEATSTDGQVDLTGAPIIFTANASAGATSASVSEIHVSDGPILADAVQVADILVFLKDDFGNAIPGHAVVINVSGQANNVLSPATLTDAEGKVAASFTSTRAELKIVTATDINSQIKITNADSVEFVALPPRFLLAESGNGQTSNVGTALPQPLVTKVTDNFGNAVGNWPVRFQFVSGGGILLESQPVRTDENGLAKATCILGPDPGGNTIEAKALNLSVPPVTFNASGRIGAPANMRAANGSNGQSGVAGEILPTKIAVEIIDAGGLPIYDHEVIFRVTFGGGSVNGREEATVRTNHFGLARVDWQLGSAVGPNIMEAEAPNLSGAKEIFTAQSASGRPTRMLILNGNNQSGTVGSLAPIGLAVQVTDPNGNPISGFLVKYQLIKGGGILTATEAVTNEQGAAGVNFIFGSKTGPRVIRTYGEGLKNSPLNFYLTARASTPTSIVILDGDGQIGTIGKPLSYPIRALVKDANGNPVKGAFLSFVPTQNNGNFPGGPNFVTDKRGIARATWTLGVAEGANKAWAILQGLPQIEFSASGVSNNLPVFETLDDLTIDELEVAEFNVSAVDDDGEIIFYGARKLPPGATFDSLVTRQFQWQTGNDNAGIHEVVFTAQDSRGALSEKLVTLTVHNVNRPPQIINWQPAASNITFTTDNLLEFAVTALDFDGDELGYLWFLDGRHVGSNSTFRWPENEIGSFELTVKVFDESDTTTQVWTPNVIVSVELSSFSASVQGSEEVRLHWTTAREVNNAGFNILRGATEFGAYEQINTELIASKNGGDYTFIDRDVETGQRYFYKLEDISVAGEFEHHGPIMVRISMPEKFELAQNYPNPFNPTTNIRFQLPKHSRVSLKIFNVLGQEVRALVEKDMAAGVYTLLWDGRNNHGLQLSSGVYYFRITAGDFVASKKMLLLK